MEFAIRPIRPDDKHGLELALERLSPETQRRRFLTAKSRFSASELRYLTEVDGTNHVALVAYDVEDPDTLLGVGRFVRLPDRAGCAEFAIVVADEVQGQGIGRALADELASAARERGIRTFTATALSDNDAIKRVMARIADHLDTRYYAGIAELEAELAA